MCIIIALPPKSILGEKEITKETLEFSWRSNKDGAGFSYIFLNKEKKPEINIIKGFFEFEDFYKAFQTKRNHHHHSSFLVHFRFSTCGDISFDNCHPFYLQSKTSCVAHNGHIAFFQNRKTDTGKSDSFLLAEFLKHLPEKWYKNTVYNTLVEKFIGAHNKVAILTADNQFHIFNKDKWFNEENIYYSSDYFKKERISNIAVTTTTTTSDNNQHNQYGTRNVYSESTHLPSIAKCYYCREPLLDGEVFSHKACIPT